MSSQKSKNENENLKYEKSINQTEVPCHNTISVPCPVCNREFEKNIIEEHVNKCLFLNTVSEKKNKRDNSHLPDVSFTGKKLKVGAASSSSPKSKVNNVHIIIIELLRSMCMPYYNLFCSRKLKRSPRC